MKLFNDNDGVLVPGNHGDYFIPYSEIFEAAVKPSKLEGKSLVVDVAIKPRIESLREHARILNLLADSMEKKELEHSCSTCYYAEPHGCVQSGGEPCDPEMGNYIRWKPKEEGS